MKLKITDYVNCDHLIIQFVKTLIGVTNHDVTLDFLLPFCKLKHKPQ